MVCNHPFWGIQDVPVHENIFPFTINLFAPCGIVHIAPMIFHRIPLELIEVFKT